MLCRLYWLRILLKHHSLLMVSYMWSIQDSVNKRAITLELEWSHLLLYRVQRCYVQCATYICRLIFLSSSQALPPCACTYDLWTCTEKGEPGPKHHVNDITWRDIVSRQTKWVERHKLSLIICVRALMSQLNLGHQLFGVLYCACHSGTLHGRATIHNLQAFALPLTSFTWCFGSRSLPISVVLRPSAQTRVWNWLLLSHNSWKHMSWSDCWISEC